MEEEEVDSRRCEGGGEENLNERDNDKVISEELIGFHLIDGVGNEKSLREIDEVVQLVPVAFFDESQICQISKQKEGE